jgi:zinc/manganese transport system permease protein
VRRGGFSSSTGAAITPAAAAQRLTGRPALALVLSVTIALVSTEGGILLALAQSSISPEKPWPTSFFISAISFAAYVGARALDGGLRMRRRAYSPRGARPSMSPGSGA